MHLNLPAISEDDETIAIGPGGFHDPHAGEALHPEREPLSILEHIRLIWDPTCLPRNTSSARRQPAG